MSTPSTLVRNRRKPRDPRGRKRLPVTLKRRDCLIFRDDEDVLNALAIAAGLTAPRWIADRIRHGGRPLAELTQPHTEET